MRDFLAHTSCASSRTTARPGNIIEAAQALIAHNSEAHGQADLDRERRRRTDTRLYTAADERDEARYVIDG
jgi:hypothetical protein